MLLLRYKFTHSFGSCYSIQNGCRFLCRMKKGEYLLKKIENNIQLPINFKYFCKSKRKEKLKTPTTSHYSDLKILLHLNLKNYPSWDISHASREKHCLDFDVVCAIILNSILFIKL